MKPALTPRKQALSVPRESCQVVSRSTMPLLSPEKCRRVILTPRFISAPIALCLAASLRGLR